MKKNKHKLSYDQILSLMSIYENEWEHRNNLFWSQTFRFFYLTVFIMALPNITSYLKITLPKLPPHFFPAIGFLVATLALYISIGYNKRLVAIANTYGNMINLLPEPYRRVKLVDIPNGKYFVKRLTSIIPFIMYVISLIVGIVLILVP